MTDPTLLARTVASLLRADPGLQGLAPQWDAEDARAHVFVGSPPLGATNAGRAPYVVIQLDQTEQPARREGDRPDAVSTVTLALRLVARRDVAALAWRMGTVLTAEPNRHLGDPAHVLGLALEHGQVDPLGPCETSTLRLHVRLLEQPGA
jgi:hypothetical protein